MFRGDMLIDMPPQFTDGGTRAGQQDGSVHACGMLCEWCASATERPKQIGTDTLSFHRGCLNPM